MLKNLIYLFVLVIGVFGYSQELSPEALSVKEIKPDIYNKILLYSKEKWGSDHEMIVYTINEQSKALYEVSKIMNTTNFDHAIFNEALLGWTEDGFTDWEMVLYTYKKQLKAKRVYEPIMESKEVEASTSYGIYLNNTSKAIRTSSPQIFLNIVHVVESQLNEDNPIKKGEAINKQVEAMEGLSNPTGNNEYNQEVMTLAISKNMQLKDGQPLIDYVGALKAYKEIIRDSQ